MLVDLRSLLLVFSILILGCLASYGQARTFELIDEEVDIPKIREHNDGEYVSIRPVGRADTLSLWVQGVTQEEGPDRDKADRADLVVWCFPDIYPSSKHALSSADRIAVVTEKYLGKRWISVVSMKTARRIGLVK